VFQITKLFQNLFSNKNQKEYYVHLFGSSYFAVKNLGIDEIIQKLEINVISTKELNEAFKYLWDEEKQNFTINQFKIIISEVYENWNFVYWKSNEFDKCLKLVEKLLSNKTIANYYYADQYVDGLAWIISNDGKIIRQFDYQMGKKLIDEGEKLTKLEAEFLKIIDENLDDFILGEDVFLSIIKKTCDMKNETFPKNVKFKIGTINI